MQSGTGLAPQSAMDQQQYPYQYQYQQPQQPPPSQQQPPYMNMMMMPPPPLAQQAQPPSVWPQQIPAQATAGDPMLQAQQQQAGADEARTLWIGDLQYWMDENYLLTCFANTGEVASVKVIRNKQTNQTEGYGFIEFYTRASAERILQTYNGAIMPNGEQKFRLNWASHSAGERRADDTPDYTIFVGDLASDVTDYLLQETFRARYPSTKGAKVVIDRLTGHTKGYGFVRFGDENEQISAMTEMNGALCSTRPMRIGPATNKKTMGTQQYSKGSYHNLQGTPIDSDPTNTTIFVGGLDSNVTDDILRQVFGQYGELVHVKIPVGKRCAFVQFADKSCAEEALQRLNGTQLGGQNIRLSWGRNPSNKQPQPDPSQVSTAMYGYAPGYESYGYAPAPQDPNLYYGYAGYGNYQQQQ